MKKLIPKIVIGLSFELTCAAALGQEFALDWFSADGGGGTSSGGTYAVSGTIGQPDAPTEPMTGGDYTVVGVFQVPLPKGPSCDPDLDGDNDVDGHDFLTFSLCYNNSLKPPQSGCANPHADLDGDSDVDGHDFLTFSLCFNNSFRPPQDGCPCLGGS